MALNDLGGNGRFFFTDSRERLVAYNNRVGGSDAYSSLRDKKTFWLVDA